MKSISVFAIGFFCGVVGYYTISNPRQVSKSVVSAVSSAEDKIEKFNYSRCRQDYLDKTFCFKRRTAQECETELIKKCGAAISNTEK